MDSLAVAVSLLALLISSAAFLYLLWWSNLRKGRLNTGAPRSLAIASTGHLLEIQAPFVFYNDGATPVVVDNLRLVFPQDSPRPLRFTGTVKNIGTTEDHAFATQFPVPARESVFQICEFQREPGALLFQEHNYQIELHARLNGQTKWQHLCSFFFHPKEEFLPNINSIRMLVYDTVEE